jgi:hypothetical protein
MRRVVNHGGTEGTEGFMISNLKSQISNLKFQIIYPLCSLCVLCASVVNFTPLLTQEGQVVAAVIPAPGARDDLTQARTVEGRHGFRYGLPPGVRDGRPHQIHVKVFGIDFELRDSPAQVSRQPRQAAPRAQAIQAGSRQTTRPPWLSTGV